MGTVRSYNQIRFHWPWSFAYASQSGMQCTLWGELLRLAVEQADETEGYSSTNHVPSTEQVRLQLDQGDDCLIMLTCKAERQQEKITSECLRFKWFIVQSKILGSMFTFTILHLGPFIQLIIAMIAPLTRLQLYATLPCSKVHDNYTQTLGTNVASL